MIIKVKQDVDQKELNELISFLKAKNFEIKDASSDKFSLFGIIGDTSTIDINDIYAYSCVEDVTRIQTPFKKASRSIKPLDTIIDLGGVKIGGDNFTVIGGPCSVESEDSLRRIAKSVKGSGANFLRGGAYKPRTSPYSFQGLGEEGLKILNKIGKEFNLKTVSEITSETLIPLFVKYVDVIQVGTRNMQNFSLLKELGKLKKPILLKRGFSATIEEWLMSAEYILAGGNENVILCERGIRTFEKYTRNTLDIQAVLAIRKLSHLPVIIDPSHASGKREMILPLSLASMAVGAHGLIIEVHDDPAHALSDGAQSVTLDQFEVIMQKLEALKKVL
jgi:3-deoxy-7-phosphoheptulonate synthase